MRYLKYPKRKIRHFLSIPFIWAVLIPLLILDFFLELYHRVCFPLYGIPKVDRKKYIRFDRMKLPYLTPFQKISCAYCSYANGLLHYASTVAGETEKYWCGIKHEQVQGFKSQPHQKDFLPYADEKAFKEFKKEKISK